MKKAIVIGATSGIGRETAARLVEEGWEVGVSGRRIEALEAFREEYGERVHIKQMDVTQEDATAGLDALIVEMGAPDLLLYVSGVGYQNRELDIRKHDRYLLHSDQLRQCGNICLLHSFGSGICWSRAQAGCSGD